MYGVRNTTCGRVRPATAVTVATTAIATITLAIAAGAASAAAPAVTTGGTSKVGQQAATLAAKVNPKGKATAVFFQIGKTKAYGTNTAETSAGAGTKERSVSSSVLGLSPATTYHYRVVARNADGTVVGGDKAFKTKNQPLGFTLEASPNPVLFEQPVTLQGVLSGTGNSGRQVALQQNAFPFTAGFATVGNPQVTGSSGAFAFPLLGVTTNAQYRVVTTAGTKVTSSIVTLGVAVRVKAKMGTHRVKRGQRVRFSGTIRPAKVGALYAIQRKDKHGVWQLVAGGTSRHGGDSFSTIDKKARIRKSGDYRVFVGVADGYQVSGITEVGYLKTRR